MENNSDLPSPLKPLYTEEVSKPTEVSKNSLITDKDRDETQNHHIYDGFNKKVLRIFEMLRPKIEYVDKVKKTKKYTNNYKVIVRGFETMVSEDKTLPTRKWVKAIAQYIEDKKKEDVDFQENIFSKKYTDEQCKEIIFDLFNRFKVFKKFNLEQNQQYFDMDEWTLIWEQLKSLNNLSTVTTTINPENMTKLQNFAAKIGQTQTKESLTQKGGVENLAQVVKEGFKTDSGVQEVIGDIASNFISKMNLKNLEDGNMGFQAPPGFEGIMESMSGFMNNQEMEMYAKKFEEFQLQQQDKK